MGGDADIVRPYRALPDSAALLQATRLHQANFVAMDC